LLGTDVILENGSVYISTLGEFRIRGFLFGFSSDIAPTASAYVLFLHSWNVPEDKRKEIRVYRY
jgi:hypothetical protein